MGTSTWFRSTRQDPDRCAEGVCRWLRGRAIRSRLLVGFTAKLKGVSISIAKKWKWSTFTHDGIRFNA